MLACYVSGMLCSCCCILAKGQLSVKNLQSHFFTALLLSSWTWSPVQTHLWCIVILCLNPSTILLFLFYESASFFFFFLRSWSQRCFWFHNERRRRPSSEGDAKRWKHHLFCLIILISKRGSVTCRGVSFQTCADLWLGTIDTRVDQVLVSRNSLSFISSTGTSWLSFIRYLVMLQHCLPRKVTC